MSDETTDTFRGSCLCGAVTYEITGAPMRVAQCCCSDCQKLTGTGHATIAFFNEATCTIDGAVSSYEKVADSGNTISRDFCPTCGSRLFGRGSGRPGMIGINVGSMDGDCADRLQPQAVVFAARCHPWDLLDEALPQFPAMPPIPKK